MDDLAQHGTSKAYREGCRCKPCCAYQNGRVARNRAERMASGRLSHGTRSAYDAGCRCEPCRRRRSETDPGRTPYGRLRRARLAMAS